MSPTRGARARAGDGLGDASSRATPARSSSPRRAAGRRRDRRAWSQAVAIVSNLRRLGCRARVRVHRCGFFRRRWRALRPLRSAATPRPGGGWRGRRPGPPPRTPAAFISSAAVAGAGSSPCGSCFSSYRRRPRSDPPPRRSDRLVPPEPRHGPVRAGSAVARAPGHTAAFSDIPAAGGISRSCHLSRPRPGSRLGGVGFGGRALARYFSSDQMKLMNGPDLALAGADGAAGRVSLHTLRARPVGPRGRPGRDPSPAPVDRGGPRAPPPASDNLRRVRTWLSRGRTALTPAAPAGAGVLRGRGGRGQLPESRPPPARRPSPRAAGARRWSRPPSSISACPR